MPKVSIAIPTYNCSQFLKEAIESVLAQTYQDFELIISDNASTDKTKELVKSFNDQRIGYYRNSKNIGMMANWNKCIELSKGNYLMILGDDDKLYPRFIEKSVKVHESNPAIGFSFTHCNKVDKKGRYMMRWGYKFTPAGYLDKYKYLDYTIKFGSCLTNSSTVLLNKRVFTKVGYFEAPFGTNTFDFNMWIKIALEYPIYFINEALCDYRIHKEQISELHWRRPERPTGKIGTYLEIINTIVCLLDKPDYYNSDKKREFLLGKLEEHNKALSFLIKESLPEL
jgi:glycosyltransferase involved in cell wall biosynthesis